MNLKTEKGFLTGRREEEFQEALSRAIQPGMSYWDIGANVGFYTLLGSQRAGPRGQVIAIEPDPENVRRLRAAVARNLLENVQVVETALSSCEGTMALERSGPMSHLRMGQEKLTAAETILVAVSTMEKLAERIGAPDVVKMDVEGAEIEVFRGMGPLLRERKPLFLVEFHSEELLAEARKLLPDYEFHPIDPGGHWRLEPRNPGSAESSPVPLKTGCPNR
ncbi:FkbM family methyltransferase [Methylacidimicrobium sp. B4]|uniref:FkbM family methyltransferase n=1 Tax=Methylacidimicrobium sp. B4 TaxID=2796139 RepID=UPI001F5D38A9|nr:FkbM family methyltransferase [Methylacidimicrobium sp. B4]